jgi:hypothetical protein
VSSPGTVPADLFVDLTALRTMRLRLHTIQQELEALDRDGEVAAEEFGGREVTDAVNEFIGKWRHGREQIAEKLANAMTILDSALSTYETAENEIGRAANSTNSP